MNNRNSVAIDKSKEFSQLPCMTYSSTLTSKNQTTLPKAVTVLLGAKPSSILAYEVLDDRSVRLTAKSATFAEHLVSFPKKKPKRPVTVAMMNRAIASEAAKSQRKTRS